MGYVRCASFNNEIGAGNLHEIMRYLATCDGLIVDVRSNSGGLLTAAQTLASVFTNEEVTVGYISHKTGPGHSDFSPPSTHHPKTREGSSMAEAYRGVGKSSHL